MHRCSTLYMLDNNYFNGDHTPSIINHAHSITCTWPVNLKTVVSFWVSFSRSSFFFIVLLASWDRITKYTTTMKQTTNKAVPLTALGMDNRVSRTSVRATSRSLLLEVFENSFWVVNPNRWLSMIGGRTVINLHTGQILVNSMQKCVHCTCTIWYNIQCTCTCNWVYMYVHVHCICRKLRFHLQMYHCNDGLACLFSRVAL